MNLKEIIIEGATFKATQNLWDFLRCLRLHRADRYLWPDAVCINQSDDSEKTHQLKLMRRIYRQAKQAHTWFGSFTQSWQDEISTIEHFTPTSKFTEEDWDHAYLRCENEILRHLQAGGKPAERKEVVNAHKETILKTFWIVRCSRSTGWPVANASTNFHCSYGAKTVLASKGLILVR